MSFKKSYSLDKGQAADSDGTVMEMEGSYTPRDKPADQGNGGEENGGEGEEDQKKEPMKMVGFIEVVGDTCHFEIMSLRGDPLEIYTDQFIN